MAGIESPLLLVGLPGLLLAAVVLLARPTRLRLLGALLGGGVLAGCNVLVDIAAHRLGWWRYPMVATSAGPGLFYVATGLWYGAGVALIGWRLIRRFGGRGLLGLLVAMAGYGPGRDYLGAAVSGAIVFGPGIAPVLGDAASWVTLTAVAQGVMRLVAGPARGDRLADCLLARRRVGMR